MRLRIFAALIDIIFMSAVAFVTHTAFGSLWYTLPAVFIAFCYGLWCFHDGMTIGD